MTTKTNGFAGKTHYLFILDKSGSMEPLAVEVISGFNKALEDLQADDPESRVTITLFDTEHSTPVEDVLATDVMSLDASRYRPSGCTALYDAMARAMRAAEKRVASGDRVLVMVVTDGQENSSMETTRDQALGMVKEMEARGNWTFTYLSASPTAFDDARTIGTQVSNTQSFDPTRAGAQAAFTNLSAARRAYTGGMAPQSASFYSGRTPSTSPTVTTVAQPVPSGQKTSWTK